ncbi:response regulator transcription factor [Herbaspirillum seropedicae]|uniref:Response regulator containing a CheY-like receiver domain and an HTH DNA-binding domain protein n=1 Tax=Herbaspirillum seropedicae (strain SmR1) TaxID=757424 RepID=D8IYS6_HERSS|nr:response regulator transcription factor [Herbaspirillum seropedicae]ADJ64261.1 response regulator containing a CheY-like receiver domain and an HTH DNA-binding domain protein [Herbaspirillum seropedicae SmR1]AKN66211.1 LuxR family transcriptional regulator [Herbaspirillum seropedicae]AON55074.1 response regulator [Herbaspirillum seropedicae]MDR6393848.1 DNA-binding NarL/FixJ family response regulator [Herbaspirillum seropedicae]NQE30704.1 LuxR family transcriptional regulator [Herbaspirillu
MSKKVTAAIKVLIADDHAIVREGLRQICAGSKDIMVAGNAANGLEAIKLAREGNGDVLLLDIVLPDRNGIDILKQIRKEQPELPVLILSIHREDQYAIRALKAGAAGFLNKQAAPAELLAAIRQAASGRKYVSPSLAQELANQIGFDHETPLHETLSDREYQTMVMIASGKTVSDIAAELTLSVKTISMYRSRVLSKMKMRHNAELTHYALKNALVE